MNRQIIKREVLGWGRLLGGLALVIVIGAGVIAGLVRLAQALRGAP